MCLTDRELLEGAARAAGIGPVIGFAAEAGELMIGPRNNIRYWNPLARDGQALRLLHAIYRKTNPDHWIRVYDNLWSGSMEDMRRAIVRAAYEIGSAKP